MIEYGACPDLDRTPPFSPHTAEIVRGIRLGEDLAFEAFAIKCDDPCHQHSIAYSLYSASLPRTANLKYAELAKQLAGRQAAVYPGLQPAGTCLFS